MLVGEKEFVGGGGEMIPQDVKNQLIDDSQLNLVAADELFVVICVTINSLTAMDGHHRPLFRVAS